MHIALAGNIGAGKTSLTKLLSKNYAWIPQYETIDNNPYLSDYYEDMQRWSFNLQVFFLKERLRNIIDIKKSKKTIIQDRTIYEDACIFAPTLRAMGYMTARDFDNYSDLFKLMTELVKAPDLLIYLKASVPKLVEQIQKRGREYESSIRLDYLSNLNERYEAWIGTYNTGKFIIVEVDNLDFVNNQSDLATVIDKINISLNGLFQNY